MKILENETLSKYTTFKMGGIAKKLYIPENIDDLLEIYKNDIDAYNYIIGGGSNLLINDKKIFKSVILLKNMNNSFKDLGKGKFYVSAFMSLQELILKINESNYGGIEYLFSVPGLVGGAIYMNAGRGEIFNTSIGDFVEYVEYLEDGEVKKLTKEECNFKYRYSKFQEMKNIVIIGAELKFKKGNKEEFTKARKERIDLCKKNQDMSLPNFGSVFKKSDPDIMEKIKVKAVNKNTDKCIFSPKSSNWLLHGKKGTFKEALREINKVKLIHKIKKKEIIPEVIIWK